MGNIARPPRDFAGMPKPDDERDSEIRLGDRLSGRFCDLTLDSVEAIREVHESE